MCPLRTIFEDEAALLPLATAPEPLLVEHAGLLHLDVFAKTVLLLAEVHGGTSAKSTCVWMCVLCVYSVVSSACQFRMCPALCT